MDIIHQVDRNKKHRIIQLASGDHVQIHVVSMFEIRLEHEARQAGRLRFEALSSLNNLEISPLYLLAEAEVIPEHLMHQASVIVSAALQFFHEYTGGRFRIADHLAVKLPAVRLQPS